MVVICNSLAIRIEKTVSLMTHRFFDLCVGNKIMLLYCIETWPSG